MSISPWYVGQTGEAFTIYCRYDSGQPVPLYDSNGSALTANQFTLLIKPSVGAETQGGGLFQVVDPDNGVVKYQPAGGDVQVAGTYQIAVRISDTGGPIYTDRTEWDIQAR